MRVLPLMVPKTVRVATAAAVQHSLQHPYSGSTMHSDKLHFGLPVP